MRIFQLSPIIQTRAMMTSCGPTDVWPLCGTAVLTHVYVKRNVDGEHQSLIQENVLVHMAFTNDVTPAGSDV